MKIENGYAVNKGMKFFAFGFFSLPCVLVLTFVFGAVFAPEEAFAGVSPERFMYAALMTIKTFLTYGWPVMLFMGAALGLAKYFSETVKAKHGNYQV